MAQAKAKKQRKETRTTEEIALQKTVDSLSKMEKRTEAQDKQLREARKSIAPLRFVRLANLRVSNALRTIAGIAKLTGSGYVSTAEQQEQIVKALQAAVEDVAAKFAGTSKEGAKFKL